MATEAVRRACRRRDRRRAAADGPTRSSPPRTRGCDRRRAASRAKGSTPRRSAIAAPRASLRCPDTATAESTGSRRTRTADGATGTRRFDRSPPAGAPSARGRCGTARPPARSARCPRSPNRRPARAAAAERHRVRIADVAGRVVARVVAIAAALAAAADRGNATSLGPRGAHSWLPRTTTHGAASRAAAAPARKNRRSSVPAVAPRTAAAAGRRAGRALAVVVVADVDHQVGRVAAAARATRANGQGAGSLQPGIPSARGAAAGVADHDDAPRLGLRQRQIATGMDRAARVARDRELARRHRERRGLRQRGRRHRRALRDRAGCTSQRHCLRDAVDDQRRARRGRRDQSRGRATVGADDDVGDVARRDRRDRRSRARRDERGEHEQ